VQGELYTGEQNEDGTIPVLEPPFAQPIESEIDVSGGHVLGRWTRTDGEDRETSVQAYVDVVRRQSPLLNADHDVFDVELLHRTAAPGLSEITWGLRYRVVSDEIRDSAVVTVTPRQRTTHLFSGFVQGELLLLDGDLILTAGTKLEHNDFTGFEFQPSVRLLWKRNRRSSLWLAVSRAVRTPSRVDDDLRLVLGVTPGDPPNVLTLNGDRSVDTEELVAFELGYRARPFDSLSIDVAAFFNTYDNLRDFFPGGVMPSGEFNEVATVIANGAEGEIYGFEVAAQWRAARWLAVLGSYSFSRAALHAGGPRTTFDVEEAEGRYPRNMARATLRFDLSPEWRVDLTGEYTDALSVDGIPSYIRVDARVGWRPRERLLVELVLRNLLDDRHPEFASDLPFFSGSEVETAAFLRATYRW